MAAGLRGAGISEVGRCWGARKGGGGGAQRGAQRAAAASTAAGGGMAWNARGNLANAEERGEHEHQWLT